MNIDILRSVRIPHNTVLFDYASTIIGSVLISYMSKVPLVIITVVAFVIGEVVHYLFGIQTNTLRYMKLL
jgi:hypothetical protein